MNAIRPPRHNLPKYERRPNESLLEKCARLTAESARTPEPGHANDNAAETPEQWWQQW